MDILMTDRACFINSLETATRREMTESRAQLYE